MQFVLLRGAHQDQDGIHEPGDVVTSDINLAERFPERFVEWTAEDEANLERQDQGGE